ncbi:hypothetical protein [Streptosporangium carneum]|nr:hypothetical protein [Streptosporangium carneum]
MNYPDREFRWWIYLPSHSTFLLRSGRETSGTTRIDVAFNDVSALELPVIMSGLTIEKPEPVKVRELLARGCVNAHTLDNLMTVRGSGYEGYIVAAIIGTDESAKRFQEDDVWGICSWAWGV